MAGGSLGGLVWCWGAAPALLLLGALALGGLAWGGGALLATGLGGLGGLWLVLGGWRTVRIVVKTLPRDLRAVWKLVRLGLHVKAAERQNLTVPKVFLRTVRRCPDKVMFHYQEEEWTFAMVEERSNRVARYFQRLGLAKGSTVAVFMENRPEFVCVWLGLAKVGLVPALVNYNLRLEALVHSVTVVRSRGLVYSSSLAPAVEDIFARLANGSRAFPTYCSGGAPSPLLPGTVHLDRALEEEEGGELEQEVQDAVSFRDKLMYIYTSGTTGLPKAAVIKHARYILASGGSTIMIGVRQEDVVYCPLPLYHSVGGMISLSGAMGHGYTMVIRDKFSASQYWKDCVRYKVTAGQYIGEICRYLTSSPTCPEERGHSVRLMFGNGLRPDIWRSFVERFGVREVSEFYGSTEGNSNILNFDNTVGAVGFVPVLFSSILPLGPIRVDEEGEAVRDPSTGLCVRCQVGEPGEFVGIIEQQHPVREFAGYSDTRDTERKVIRDVWSKGDMCFRSGDILVSDELGYLYFRDRKGDTFRWKGENVSTTEVERVVSSAGGLGDCVVYGVQVGSCEGRAGMAAVVGEVDTARLAEEVVAQLPTYARPVFLRLPQAIDITGTYKLKKMQLQAEGCDPSMVQDPLFLLHPATRTYVPLTPSLYSDVMEGRLRL